MHAINARMASRDLFDPNAAARLVVTFNRAGIKYGATAEVFDEKGNSVWKRAFVPLRQCDVLVGDIGVAVASRFDFPAPPAPEAPAPAAPVNTPPAAPSADAAKDPTAPDRADVNGSVLPVVRSRATTEGPRARRRGIALSAAASGGVGLGVSPADVAGVVDIEGGVAWQLDPQWLLSGSVGALWSPRASASASWQMAPREGQVVTTLITGVALLCAHRQIVRPWVFFCAGGEGGWLYGGASRGGRSLGGGQPWVAFEPRLGVEMPLPPVRHLPRLAVRGFGNMVVPAPVHLRVIEGSSTTGSTTSDVWATHPIAGAFHLGVVAWFDL